MHKLTSNEALREVLEKAAITHDEWHDEWDDGYFFGVRDTLEAITGKDRRELNDLIAQHRR